MRLTVAILLACSLGLLAAAAQAQPAAGVAPASNQAAPTDTNSLAPPPTAPATNAATSSASAPAPPPKQKGGFTTIDIPPPPDGKGQIVAFRKNEYVGWAVWFNIRDSGKLLGKLTNGSYFVAALDPGPHILSAATENKDTLNLNVAPGETYFVEGTVSMGVLIGEANIQPSDQASFDNASHKLKLSGPPPDDSASSRRPAATP